MKYLPIILFLIMLGFGADNRKEHILRIISNTSKAKNIDDLQYLFPLPDKAENIILLTEYNTFGDYRKAVVHKFCIEVEEEVYLQFKLEDSQLTLPMNRPYCGEDLVFKDRDVLRIYQSDDIHFYEKHLLNYGKEKKWSETPQEAFLLIYLKDESPIESLQTIIIGIVKEYKNIIDKQCQVTYRKSLKDCSNIELRKILKQVPFRVTTRSLPEGEML